MKSYPRKYAIGIYIIFLVFLQEVILRILFPVPELKTFDRVNYVQLGASDKKIAPVRNVNLVVSSSPDSAEFVNKLNLYGFRDKNWKMKKSASRRMIFIGDSFVEGELSSPDSIIPASFKRRAEQDGQQYDIMNFGLMATNTAEYLRIAYDIVPFFRPDNIFIVFYANDFSTSQNIYGRRLEDFRFNPLRPRLLELLLILRNGGGIPFLWNYRNISFFKPFPDLTNPWSQRQDELRQLVTPEIYKAIEAGKFNPFAVNDMIHKERYLRSEFDISDELTSLKAFLNKYHCKLFIAYIPCRHQTTSYYQKFEKTYCLNCPDSIDLTKKIYNGHAEYLTNECRRLGIPFIDMTPKIEQEERSNNHLYWNYDEHFRGKGYFVAGSWIYDFWKENDNESNP